MQGGKLPGDPPRAVREWVCFREEAAAEHRRTGRCLQIRNQRASIAAAGVQVVVEAPPHRHTGLMLHDVTPHQALERATSPKELGSRRQLSCDRRPRSLTRGQKPCLVVISCWWWFDGSSLTCHGRRIRRTDLVMGHRDGA